jgi:hypothetical protein
VTLSGLFKLWLGWFFFARGLLARKNWQKKMMGIKKRKQISRSAGLAVVGSASRTPADCTTVLRIEQMLASSRQTFPLTEMPCFGAMVVSVRLREARMNMLSGQTEKC